MISSGRSVARHLEVVGRQAVAEAAAAGVDLDEERARLLGALQLDEVVAAAERAELIEPALGPALAAPGDLPVVVDRDAVALGAAAVEARAVLLDVVLGAAADELLELASSTLPSFTLLPPAPRLDALHHLAVERELAVGRRALGGDLGAARSSSRSRCRSRPGPSPPRPRRASVRITQPTGTP